MSLTLNDLSKKIAAKSLIVSLLAALFFSLITSFFLPAETVIARFGVSLVTVLLTLLVAHFYVHWRFKLSIVSEWTKLADSVEGVAFRSDLNKPIKIQSGIQEINAIAYEFSMLQKQLAMSLSHDEELALKDQITDAYNRAFYEFELKKYTRLYNRYQLPFGFILCEIACYDEIVLRFGPDHGERALTHFVKMVKVQCRETDELFHVGNGVFAILIPDATRVELERIKLKLERFRSRAPLLTGDENMPKLKLSLSFGYVMFGSEAGDIESLLSLANQRLIQDKASKLQGMGCDHLLQGEK